MPEATLNPPSAPCPECGQIVPAEPAVHGGGLITHCPRHGRIRLDPRRPSPPAAPPPPPSGSVALETMAGQMVKCPQCGRPAEVKALADHHGEGPNAEPIVSAPWWLEIACERCGRKLHRAATMVEPIGPLPTGPELPADPPPSGVVPIGRAIGHLIECPDCHQPAIVATAQGTGARREANQSYVLAECAIVRKLWPAATPVRVLTPEERPAEVPSATPPYARGAMPR